MKLDQWMTDNGVSNDEMARKLGRDPSVVSRLRRGQTNPSLEVLATLEVVTAGQVTVTDFAAPRPQEGEAA